MLCGEKIGEGIHRVVYRCKLRPELVVKVEAEENYRYFANVREMDFWSYHSQYKKVADWVASSRYLSRDGRILLQDKCIPCGEHDEHKMPTKLPAFITDRKYSNFGWLNDKIVVLDYGLVIHNPSLKLTKAEYWS